MIMTKHLRTLNYQLDMKDNFIYVQSMFHKYNHKSCIGPHHYLYILAYISIHGQIILENLSHYMLDTNYILVHYKYNRNNDRLIFIFY